MASLGSFKKGIVSTKGGLGQTGISTSTGAAPAPSYNFGNALLFNGGSDEVTHSRVAIGTTWTQSVWVKPISFTNCYLFGDSATTARYLRIDSASQITVRQIADKTFAFPSSIVLNEWNHIFLTASSNSVRVYVNGVESTTGAQSYTNQWFVGAVGFAYTLSSCQAILDEFGVLVGTAGTAQNAVDIWNSGLGAGFMDIMGSATTYFKFDESSGATTAVDSSGNGDNGTVTGAYFVPHSYDTDASIYIAEASITDTTEQAAVNQLVLDLKGTGSTPSSTDLWTNAAAIWPVSPTSLAAAAYNLRDTTSFNYTWVNSPTHASTGVTFNGSTQYGDTNLTPSSLTLANGYDITLCVEIANGDATSVGLLAGRYGNNANQRTQMMLINGNVNQDIHAAGTARLTTTTSGTYNGRFVATADRVDDGGKANYLNGSSLGTLNAQDNGAPYTYNIYTGAQNAQNSATPVVANASDFEYRFGCVLKEGLTSTEVADLDDAIARYSTALRPSYDPDAVAYFTAAGITDTAEKDAVNQLVLDLKGTGSTTNNTDVWTDSDVISPISPTSLAAAAFNLKNPATFQTTWYNTPTHSANGVSGNGTTQYGDVGWNPSTDGLQDNVGITVAINTDVTTNTNDCGVRDGSASFFQVLSYFSGAANSVINQIPITFPTAANATSVGVYTGVRTSSTAVGLYKNGASIATSSRVSVAPPNGNVFLLARNLIGTGAESFTTRRFTFAAIHKGLTANQAQDLYDAITNYNRTVLAGTLDSDALAYIEAAGITDRVECAAVNQLVKDLKGTGSTTNNTDVWTDSDVIYPLSPTSLDAAAFNLKDPSAFEITWFNTPTHSTTGITGNGTTQYANTGYNHITEGASINNMGFTYSGDYKDFDRAMGAVNTGQSPNSYFELSCTAAARNFYGGQNGNQASFSATARGVSTGVRSAADNRVVYFDGVAGTANTTTDTAAFPNLDIFLLSRNVNGSPAAYFAGEVDFYALHKALTANQAQDLYDAITTYNRTVVAGTLDSDALAYIEAAGITDRVECAAVNQLVKDLKGTGSTPNGTDLWTDAVQVLGVSPTSLVASTYNIKNTAKNLTYLNSPTHTAGGVTFNGTTQYAATGVIPSSDGLDSFTLTIALGGTTTDTSFGRMITVNQGTGQRLQLRQTAGNLLSDIYNSSSITAATTTTSGFFTATSTSNSDGRIFKGATKLATDVSLAGTVPDLELYIGALNNSGSPQNHSVFTFNCAYISAAGYDDNGIADLDDAFNRYNTALNR